LKDFHHYYLEPTTDEEKQSITMVEDDGDTAAQLEKLQQSLSKKINL
jgi:hypothetical protein